MSRWISQLNTLSALFKHIRVADRAITCGCLAALLPGEMDFPRLGLIGGLKTKKNIPAPPLHVRINTAFADLWLSNGTVWGKKWGSVRRDAALLCEFIAKVPYCCLLTIDELLKALTTTPLTVHWLRWRVKRLICGQDGCCNQQGLYVRGDLMSPFTLWAKKPLHPLSIPSLLSFGFFPSDTFTFRHLTDLVVFSLPRPHFLLVLLL